jgi:hypothetical protein
VRYVAVYLDGDLRTRQRARLAGASASESDRYEELLVNPTLLTLATQRGDIDCGGLTYLLIRYGNFFTLIQPLARGHVNVGFELGAALEPVIGAVRQVVADWAAARSLDPTSNPD